MKKFLDVLTAAFSIQFFGGGGCLLGWGWLLTIVILSFIL